MTLLLPTVAVAFAAFCVWLTVRIVNRRERWAKWTAVAVVAVVAVYPLSVGPVDWLWYNNLLPRSSHRAIGIIYEPITRLQVNSEAFFSVMYWYCSLWAPFEDA